MYKYQLPAAGPLATPLLHRYIRKQIISIRSHYKRTYYNCNLILEDGFRSWYGVYSLLIRSGIDLKLFIVFSCIVNVTDMGKDAMSLAKLLTIFKGIFHPYYLTKCRRKLEKIDFIKIYNYNPFDPAGPCKHITLTGKGFQFTPALKLEPVALLLSFNTVIRSHGSWPPGSTAIIAGVIASHDFSVQSRHKVRDKLFSPLVFYEAFNFNPFY